MATPTFYHPQLTAQDKQVVLSESEAGHALKSRRLRDGNAVQLINGCGLLAQASLIIDGTGSVKVGIDSCVSLPRPSSISIGTAVPKGDRQRTMVDMLSQLGVRQVFPLNCEYSVTRFKPAMLGKWQRWSIEACKQAQNSWLPEIHDAVHIEKILALPGHNIVYADAHGQSLISLAESHNDLLILVGPEGGFSEAEQDLLHNKNCAAISLGSTILRTELASVTALAQSFMKDN